MIQTFTSVGLEVQAKSFLEQVTAELQQEAPSIDWLDYLRHDEQPEELLGVTQLKQQMVRVAFTSGRRL